MDGITKLYRSQNLPCGAPRGDGLDVAPRLHPLFRHAPERLRSLRLAIPADLSAWGRDALCALYGIDSTSFEVYDPDTEVLACRAALIPTMAHTSYAFHPAAQAFYDHAAALCRSVPVEAGGRGLLYVTRRQFARTVAGRPVRLLENAADAEALATSLGFELVAPEELSWREQIALFSRAKVVAGEHGSAMKGLLFAPRETCAVVINHLNSTQGDIAALRGQRCFILQANGFDPDRSLEPHRVDLSKLGACLEHALSVVKEAHLRPRHRKHR